MEPKVENLNDNSPLDMTMSNFYNVGLNSASTTPTTTPSVSTTDENKKSLEETQFFDVFSNQ